MPNIALPKHQDEMIAAIAAANPRTAVVLKDSASVLMPWIDKVPAVMEAWYPGQEDGEIVARLLLGLAAPAGKTPVTYPRAAADLPLNTAAQFPGIRKDNRRTVSYSEGLAMGYRSYDARAVAPLFPFGFGLSYTRFKLSGFTVTPAGGGRAKVRFLVRNTGRRRGAEVPQVYLGFPTEAGEPPKRLVGFEKVWLDAGEKRAVEIELDPTASNHPFGVFDSAGQRWKTVPGRYTVMLGTSSRDIVASAPFAVGTP